MFAAMRPWHEYERVKKLLDAGLSEYAVAAKTGVPRSTVNNWRHRNTVPALAGAWQDWRPWDGERYCYLLGAYLGDGHVARCSTGSATLTLTLDARYRGLIAEAKEAIESLEPWLKARCRPHNRGAAVILQATTPVILGAFPQRGPGRKHLRRIRLAPWQPRVSMTRAPCRRRWNGLSISIASTRATSISASVR